MTATIASPTAMARDVETTRGTLVERALLVRRDGRAGVGGRPPAPGRPARIGTVGGGCLLEIRDETLGRYLAPGDEVVLEIERLGRLRSPMVARPG